MSKIERKNYTESHTYIDTQRVIYIIKIIINILYIMHKVIQYIVI